jgi:hypothetical protein
VGGEEKKNILLNIKPINYDVTSTYTSDIRTFFRFLLLFSGKFEGERKARNEFIWHRKYLHIHPQPVGASRRRKKKHFL